ncbi:Decaprenyl diphosphate synthase-like protein [Chytridium lagenaria]|nr:Decaprenyl diphosphate synthase-like protein [Chytridium lagenaria]
MPSSFSVTLRSMPWSLCMVVATVMAWIHGRITRAMEDLILSILKLGPVPKHVAFIMDGNRRYAKGKGMMVQKGHQQGFEKLENTLDWCLRLGVKVVTVYAFSTENFNRDPHEVQLLMDLAGDKFEDFATKRCARSLKTRNRRKGVWKRLPSPPKGPGSCITGRTMTRNNSGAILNVCIPYTSREKSPTPLTPSSRC